MDSTPSERVSTEEVEIESLSKLKALIFEDEELKNYKSIMVEDELLMIIVRGHECRVDSAFRTLKSLKKYMDTTYPELFIKTNPKSVKHVLDKKLYEVVQRPFDSGPTVLVFRTKRWNTREASVDDLIAAGVLYVFQLSKMSVEIQRKGVVAIIDTSGFGFSHAAQSTYDTAMKILNCLSYASPVRFLAFYFINAHRLFEKMFNLLKYLIPEHARTHIFITKKNFSSLHKLVSSSALPASLGGEMVEENAWMIGLEDIIYQDDQIYRMVCEAQEICGN